MHSWDYGRCLWHCQKYDHKYNLSSSNFKLKLECQHCKTVFVDEIGEDE